MTPRTSDDEEATWADRPKNRFDAAAACDVATKAAAAMDDPTKAAAAMDAAPNSIECLITLENALAVMAAE